MRKRIPLKTAIRLSARGFYLIVEIFKLCGENSITPARENIKRLQKNCRDFRSGAVVPLDFIRARYYTVAGLPQGGSDFLISGQNMHRFHAVKRADGKFFGTQPVWKILRRSARWGKEPYKSYKGGRIAPAFAALILSARGFQICANFSNSS